MRILHTADWHLGKHLEGMSRLEEQEAFLKDFIALSESQNIDLIIIAGDVYDSSNPPSKAETLFYETLKKLSRKGACMTLVIAGNHDNPERLVAAGPLAREHGILMAGTPKTIIETGKYGNHQVVASGEGYIEIEIGGERAVILTVPYPSEKRLNEVLYEDLTTDEERLESYTDRIHQLFEQLSDHYREDTINLAVTHLFAMGSVEGGSERSIQLGGSYIIDGSCLPEKAQYIALGHVHKPQVVPGSGGRARYSGSPIHYNKKEIHFEKSCILIDAKAGEPALIETLPLPVYKPIQIWKCSGVAEALKMAEEKQEEESWVYLEIETDSYIREDEIKAIKGFKKDILELTPIFNNHPSQTDGDLLRAFSEKSFSEHFKDFYSRERGTEPEEALTTYLMNILEEVAE